MRPSRSGARIPHGRRLRHAPDVRSAVSRFDWFTIRIESGDASQGQSRNRVEREYVRLYFTPTGRITDPVLTIHTTWDPLVLGSETDAGMRATSR